MIGRKDQDQIMYSILTLDKPLCSDRKSKLYDEIEKEKNSKYLTTSTYSTWDNIIAYYPFSDCSNIFHNVVGITGTCAGSVTYYTSGGVYSSCNTINITGILQHTNITSNGRIYPRS